MKERSLVTFTLLLQAGVGMVWGLLLAAGLTAPNAGPGPGMAMAVAAALAAAGIAASVFHLGSPRRAWRAAAGVRHSWLSREVVLAAVFAGGAAVLAGYRLARPDEAAVVSSLPALVGLSLVGAGLIYSMARVYRLRTVPAWDTALTTAGFFLTAASLGVLTVGVVLSATGQPSAAAVLASVASAILALELMAEPVRWQHESVARERVDNGLWPKRRPRWTRFRAPALTKAMLVAAAAAMAAAAGAGTLGEAGPGAVDPVRDGGSGPGATLVIVLLVVALAADGFAQVAARVRFYADYARLGA